jgi:hypothetical protein
MASSPCVYEYVSECHECTLAKPGRTSSKNPRGPTVGRYPFDLLYADILSMEESKPHTVPNWVPESCAPERTPASVLASGQGLQPPVHPSLGRQPGLQSQSGPVRAFGPGLRSPVPSSPSTKPGLQSPVHPSLSEFG